MKVLYFSKTDSLGPGSRYRIFQFRKFFEEKGIDLTIAPAFSDSYIEAESLMGHMRHLKRGTETVKAFFKRVIDFRRIFEADVIAIEREFFPRFPPLFEFLIKVFKGGYVLEFDDAIFLSPGRVYKYPFTIRMASKVVTGNEYLREYALPYNPKVSVIPTCVDTGEYSLRDDYRKAGAPAIGWVGLPYNFGHLELIRTPLERITGEKKGEFHVLSGRDPHLGFPVTFKKWTCEREAEWIRGFDVGVMPLWDTPFARGKCGLKLIQYMAAGVPVVASPVGVNCEIVEEGVNGFLASCDDEWYEKLSILLGDEKLREEMGRMGRRKVEKYYSLEVWGNRLVNLYSEERGQ